MSRKKFEGVMLSALKGLPPLIREKFVNVAVVIEDGKTPRDLLGLYEGRPLTERALEESGSAPDKITLYKRNLEDMCGGDKKRLRLEIRRTLAHEIAHHFGISDERLEELGLS